MSDEQVRGTFGLPYSNMDRPPCPKCPSRMSLARIMSGPKGYDKRTFECTKCHHVETLTVAYDPMKGGVVAWLQGGLIPPK
jgi:hypothetical protein